jgi:hypothetical protein
MGFIYKMRGKQAWAGKEVSVNVTNIKIDLELRSKI